MGSVGSSFERCELLFHFSGPRSRLALKLAHRRPQRRRISALGRNTAQLEHGGKIVRLHTQNLLNQLLKIGLAMFVALSFDFRGKLVNRSQVSRVELDRLSQLSDRFCRIATIALKKPLQIEQSIVAAVERHGTIESLCRHVEGALAERQNTPVCPSCRLCRHKLCSFGKAAFCANIVSHLQGCQSDIEDRNEVRICLRGPVG